MRPAAITAVLVCLITTSAFAQRRPIIESIEPRSGLPNGGTTVTIRGKNLYPYVPPVTAPKPDCTPCPPRPPQVLFGGKSAGIVSYSDDTLVVKTPPNAGGLYDVQVDNAYFNPPSITTLPRAFQYGDNDLDRVLVPIVADRVLGAFGSIWSAELVGRNDNDVDIQVQQSSQSGAPPGLGAHNSTFRPKLLTQGGGAFMYIGHVDPPLIPISFNLRVRDISREESNWGTEVPVVRAEDGFVNRPIHLLHVPFEGESRVTLRIYDLDGVTGGQVPVIVRDNESERVLASIVVSLPGYGEYFDYPAFPGYVQLDVGSLIGNPSAIRRIRIQVGEQFLQKRLWAMASVTDQETQLATLITPTR